MNDEYGNDALAELKKWMNDIKGQTNTNKNKSVGHFEMQIIFNVYKDWILLHLAYKKSLPSTQFSVEMFSTIWTLSVGTSIKKKRAIKALMF